MNAFRNIISYLIYETLSSNRQQKHEEFLHEDARDLIPEQGNMADSRDDDNPVSSQKPTPREPSAGPPGRLSGNFSRYDFGETVGGRHGKSNILSGNVEFVLCVRSRVQRDTLGISLSLHFTKDLFLKMSHPEKLLVHLCAENLTFSAQVYLLYMLYFKMSCVYCCELSCVLLSSYVYLLYYVCIVFTLDARLLTLS